MNLQISGKAKTENNAYSNSPQNQFGVEYDGGQHTPVTLTLDKKGTIEECSDAVESLFSYNRRELIWQHISCLFPQFLDIELIMYDRLNPFLNYICHCDFIFESLTKRGEVIFCNLNIFLIEHEGISNVKLIVRPIDNAEI